MSGEGGAKCGALSSDSDASYNLDSHRHELQIVAFDADLAEVVEQWPLLPEAVRLAIMALVRTVK